MKRNTINRKKERTELLNNIYERIIKSHTVREILKAIIESAQAIVGDDKRLEIFLFDKETNELRLEIYNGGKNFSNQISGKIPARIKMGKGIVGWVAQERKHLLISDIKTSDFYQEGNNMVQSQLALPLFGNEKNIIGVLNVESENPHDFTQDGIDSLSYIINHASIAIENSLIDLEKKALFEIRKSLKKYQRLEELCRIIVREIKKYFNAEGCSLFFFDEKKKRLILAATTGLKDINLKDPNIEIEYSLGEGLTGWVAKHRRSLCVNNVRDKNELKRIHDELEHKGKFKEAEPEQYLAAPLMNKKKLIGVLRLKNSLDRDNFSYSEELLLRNIVNYLSVDIEETRGYSEFEALYKISKSLFSRTSKITDKVLGLEDLLSETVSRIAEYLDADGCSIFLIDENDGKLKLTATTGLKNVDVRNSKEKIEYKLGEGLTGWVAYHGRPLCINNVKNKNELKKIAPDLKWKGKFIEADPKQFVAVPLKIGGKTKGVVRLPNKKSGRGFTTHDQKLLEALADQIVITIVTASLAEKRIKEIQKSHTIKLDLLHNIYHTLRTPLAAIMMYSKEVVKNNLNSSRKRDYLNIILREVEKYYDVVENLYNYLKTDTVGFKVARYYFDIDELVQEIKEIFEPQLKEKRLQFKYIRNLPRPRKVFADPRLLETVIRNLINNAIDFSYQNKEIELNVEDKENIYQFNIVNYGFPLLKEEYDKIFDEFYQGDITRTPGRAVRGCGLGLSIAKRIIEAHGGKIWVEKSDVETGTQFSFTLPQPGI